MRYLLPMLIVVGCGPGVEMKCTAGSCATGKTCNVNTGLCVAGGTGGGSGGGGGHTGAGGGSGTGGGTSSTGGGSGGGGGGSGGGGQSEDITVRMHYDVQSCPTGVCTDCTLSTCVKQATVPLNTFNGWKTGRYVGCQFTSDASGQIIDCTTNCQQGSTACTTAGGEVQRKTFACANPDGSGATCSWSP